MISQDNLKSITKPNPIDANLSLHLSRSVPMRPPFFVEEKNTFFHHLHPFTYHVSSKNHINPSYQPCFSLTITTTFLGHPTSYRVQVGFPPRVVVVSRSSLSAKIPAKFKATAETHVTKISPPVSGGFQCRQIHNRLLLMFYSFRDQIYNQQGFLMFFFWGAIGLNCETPFI